MIGKLSQVAVERVLGTTLGGLFGFAAFRWPPPPRPSPLQHLGARASPAELDALRHAAFLLCSEWGRNRTMRCNRSVVPSGLAGRLITALIRVCQRKVLSLHVVAVV